MAEGASRVSKFVLGADGRGAIKVDLVRLVDTRALIQANSGGGKSWLLRLVAERAARKVQLLLIDPEGEFATLREKLDIALVGHGGELAADVRSAGLLARKLAETRVSAIVDLYELKLPDRRRFVRLFLESLLAVPRAHWHPLLVMLDECHLFAPERSAGEAESTEAVIALMSQGRKRGFAGLLSTQRLSKLHKDAAAEANNVFIGRTWLDVDQQRAGDLLGMGKADRQALRDLAPGEFFAFGPCLSKPGVVRFRSDAVATTHPKAGQRHLMEVPPASNVIQDIVRQIGDLPAQAEAEVRDFAAARTKIAELERQLRGRPAQLEHKIERVVEKVETPIFQAGEVERIEEVARGLAGQAASLASVAQEISQALQKASALVAAAVHAPARARIAPAPVARRAPDPPAASAENGGLPKAERRILTALAQYPSGRSKTQLAILAGYAVKGGGFNNAIGALRSRGWLTGDTTQLQITEIGIAALGSWDPLPSGPDLIDYWLRQLPKAERSALAVLVEVWPQSLPKEELAARAGYEPSGGGFNNALGKLRTLELIEGRGELRASDALLAGGS